MERKGLLLCSCNQHHVTSQPTQGQASDKLDHLAEDSVGVKVVVTGPDAGRLNDVFSCVGTAGSTEFLLPTQCRLVASLV